MTSNSIKNVSSTYEMWEKMTSFKKTFAILRMKDIVIN
jgi:hypothetical protein